MPRHTGQTLLFGGAPNAVEHPQKILLAVSSWTCTSSPITGSYFVLTGSFAAVDISGNYTNGALAAKNFKCARNFKFQISNFKFDPGLQCRRSSLLKSEI
jgi:hypothetical protein